MRIKTALTLCLTIIISALSLAGCTNSKIRLDKNNSHLLGDFKVENGKVLFSCSLAVENLTDDDLTVKITAYSKEDVDGGLLKQAKMSGYCEDMISDTFKMKSGESSVTVIFVGDFAGRQVKHDRLVPDDIRFEIVDSAM